MHGMLNDFFLMPKDLGYHKKPWEKIMKRISLLCICLTLSSAVISDEIILDCIVDNYGNKYLHKYNNSGPNGPEVLVFHKDKWNQFCVDRGQKVAGEKYWARQIKIKNKVYQCITEYYESYPTLSLTSTSHVDFNKDQYTRVYVFADNKKKRKQSSHTHECMLKSLITDDS